MIETTSLTKIIDRYDRLWTAMRARYHERILKADPRLPNTWALMQEVKKWGNEEARAMCQRMIRVLRYLAAREDREYKRAEAKLRAA